MKDPVPNASNCFGAIDPLGSPKSSVRPGSSRSERAWEAGLEPVSAKPLVRGHLLLVEENLGPHASLNYQRGPCQFTQGTYSRLHLGQRAGGLSRAAGVKSIRYSHCLHSISTSGAPGPYPVKTRYHGLPRCSSAGRMFKLF